MTAKINTAQDTKGKINRQKIVDSANVLFYRNGFNKTSFSEVAKTSGIPKGNIYFYFKSKDEILSAVINARFENIQQKLIEYETEYDSPLGRLQRLAHMPLTDAGDVIKYGCPIGSLTAELAKLRSPEKVQMQKLFELYINWAEKQFQDLGLGDKANELARTFIIRLQGIITIANAYESEDFLRSEIEQLKSWIQSVSVEALAK